MSCGFACWIAHLTFFLAPINVNVPLVKYSLDATNWTCDSLEVNNISAQFVAPESVHFSLGSLTGDCHGSWTLVHTSTGKVADRGQASVPFAATHSEVGVQVKRSNITLLPSLLSLAPCRLHGRASPVHFTGNNPLFDLVLDALGDAAAPIIAQAISDAGCGALDDLLSDILKPKLLAVNQATLAFEQSPGGPASLLAKPLGRGSADLARSALIGFPGALVHALGNATQLGQLLQQQTKDGRRVFDLSSWSSAAVRPIPFSFPLGNEPGASVNGSLAVLPTKVVVALPPNSAPWPVQLDVLRPFDGENASPALLSPAANVTVGELFTVDLDYRVQVNTSSTDAARGHEHGSFTIPGSVRISINRISLSVDLSLDLDVSQFKSLSSGFPALLNEARAEKNSTRSSHLIFSAIQSIWRPDHSSVVRTMGSLSLVNASLTGKPGQLSSQLDQLVSSVLKLAITRFPRLIDASFGRFMADVVPRMLNNQLASVVPVHSVIPTTDPVLLPLYIVGAATLFVLMAASSSLAVSRIRTSSSSSVLLPPSSVSSAINSSTNEEIERTLSTSSTSSSSKMRARSTETTTNSLERTPLLPTSSSIRRSSRVKHPLSSSTPLCTLVSPFMAHSVPVFVCLAFCVYFCGTLSADFEIFLSFSRWIHNHNNEPILLCEGIRIARLLSLAPNTRRLLWSVGGGGQQYVITGVMGVGWIYFSFVLLLVLWLVPMRRQRQARLMTVVAVLGPFAFMRALVLMYADAALRLTAPLFDSDSVITVGVNTVNSYRLNFVAQTMLLFAIQIVLYAFFNGTNNNHSDKKRRRLGSSLKQEEQTEQSYDLLHDLLPEEFARPSKQLEEQEEEEEEEEEISSHDSDEQDDLMVVEEWELLSFLMPLVRPSTALICTVASLVSLGYGLIEFPSASVHFGSIVGKALHTLHIPTYQSTTALMGPVHAFQPGCPHSAVTELTDPPPWTDGLWRPLFLSISLVLILIGPTLTALVLMDAARRQLCSAQRRPSVWTRRLAASFLSLAGPGSAALASITLAWLFHAFTTSTYSLGPCIPLLGLDQCMKVLHLPFPWYTAALLLGAGSLQLVSAYLLRLFPFY